MEVAPGTFFLSPLEAEAISRLLRLHWITLEDLSEMPPEFSGDDLERLLPLLQRLEAAFKPE